MTPNKHPWKATVNADPLSSLSAKANPLSVVKKTTPQLRTAYTSAVIAAKRYSFDDNGGGYLGL